MKFHLALIALLLPLAPALGADTGFPVTTAPLERVEEPASVRAYGVVAERSHYLYFELPGNLARLHADAGDSVAAGQLLAELDTLDIDSELGKAEEDLKHARIKYGQYRELSSHNAASRDQLEDWRHQFELAKLQLAHLKERREKHELRAPAAGRLTDRLVDFAGPVASDTALFRLDASDAPLRISAELTQREAAQVHLGAPARILLPESSQTALSGTLARLRPAGSGDGLFSADIALDPLPAGLALSDGMQVEVIIDTRDTHTGYRVPITALLAIDGDRGKLFVVEENRAKSITARIARVTGDRAMLEGDLAAYQRVVIRGQHQLTDGAVLDEDGAAEGDTDAAKE